MSSYTIHETQPFDEGDDSVHALHPAQLEIVRSLQGLGVEPVDETLAAVAHARRLTPDEKKQARTVMKSYVERTIKTNALKHYSQHRPMTHLYRAPQIEWTADCSGYDTGVFAWAKRNTGLPIEDPNGASFAFSGWGFTGTLLAANYRRQIPAGRRFFIGDMGIYGRPSSTVHTVFCFKGGDALSSVWASHGNEAGPYAVRLHYRPDLLCVVRSWSLQ